MTSILGNITRNVLAGARLAFFRPVTPQDFRVSPGDFAALVAFNFVVMLAASMARNGFPGELDPGALMVFLSQVPLVLGAAVAMCAIMSRREQMLSLATALIAVDPLLELAGTVVTLVLPFDEAPLPSVLIGWCFLAWAFAAAVRALVIHTGWVYPRAGFATGVIALLFAFSLAVLPRAELWNADADDDSAATVPDTGITEERVFHLQQGLLADALARLEPERPGVVDLYFLGVAPYASEDVFAKEVSAVRRMFDERFGTDGRSLALVNSPDTLEHTPIATATNLKAALQQLGKIMNPDEDVLFLFITSHGDARHEIAFDLPPLALAQLTPTALARMLHESGIKWKVLVVSACYSGGYVEPLRDANTVVITASDDRNPSFGCANGRDFTYFGQAFFGEGLAKTFSVADAFEKARASVTAREAAERLNPSSPQIYMGAAIRDKLGALERRLVGLR